jgi:hypothetical protein
MVHACLGRTLWWWEHVVEFYLIIVEVGKEALTYLLTAKKQRTGQEGVRHNISSRISPY